jgi:hypothetical protein
VVLVRGLFPYIWIFIWDPFVLSLPFSHKLSDILLHAKLLQKACQSILFPSNVYLDKLFVLTIEPKHVQGLSLVPCNINIAFDMRLKNIRKMLR